MRRVVVESKKNLFEDFFCVEEAFVRYELFDGQMSDPVRRLVMQHATAGEVQDQAVAEGMRIERQQGAGRDWPPPGTADD